MDCKLLLACLFFLILVPTVSANRITLDQEQGWITEWYEVKHVSESDVGINSELRLHVFPLSEESNATYGFYFSTGEPISTIMPKDFKVRIFQDCSDGPHELTQDTDFSVSVEEFGGTINYYIEINLYNSSYTWSVYEISIDYTLKEFVRKKGDSYLQFNKHCTDYTSNKTGCPANGTVIESIMLINPAFKVIENFDFSRQDIADNGTEKVTVIGLHNAMILQFSDVEEELFWTPLWWAIAASILGALFGGIMSQILDRRSSLHHFLRNRSRIQIEEIHPNECQRYFRLDDKDHNGQKVRRLGFLAYLSIINKGTEPFSISSYTLRILDKNNKEHELKPRCLPEPCLNLGKYKKYFPVLGQKTAHHEDGTLRVLAGDKISGFVFYVAEFHEDEIPDIGEYYKKIEIEIRTVAGDKKIKGLKFTEADVDTIRKLIDGIDDVLMYG